MLFVVLIMAFICISSATDTNFAKTEAGSTTHAQDQWAGDAHSKASSDIDDNVSSLSMILPGVRRFSIIYNCLSVSTHFRQASERFF